MLINKAGTDDSLSIVVQRGTERGPEPGVERTRYVREDGMVGVIISPSFGGGFSTWSSYPEMALDPVLVEWVLEMNSKPVDSTDYNIIRDKIQTYVVGPKYNASYHGDRLEVEWLPPGTRFIIHEYDGAESIWCEHEIKWSVA